MWRKRTIRILSILGLLLALPISIWLLNGVILRSNSPAALKTVVQLLVPPKDLYKPLVAKSIDFEEGTTLKIPSYHHEYVGNHELGIFFDNPDALTFQTNSKLRLIANLECSVEGKLRYSRIIESGNLFFGSQGSGYGLNTYVVPRDLPLDETISCMLTVSGMDIELIKKYGPIRIYVKKVSDV